MDFNQVIFKDKTFSSLLEDIYKNANRKEKEIKALIDQLKPMIQEPGDAMMLVPLLKEYMELAIKNDDALIKMAGIVQRAMSNGGNGGDGTTVYALRRTEAHGRWIGWHTDTAR